MVSKSVPVIWSCVYIICWLGQTTVNFICVICVLCIDVFWTLAVVHLARCWRDSVLRSRDRKSVFQHVQASNWMHTQVFWQFCKWIGNRFKVFIAKRITELWSLTSHVGSHNTGELWTCFELTLARQVGSLIPEGSKTKWIFVSVMYHSFIFNDHSNVPWWFTCLPTSTLWVSMHL